MFDLDTALKPYFLPIPTNKENKFGIQKYRVLKYKPCGTLAVSNTYYPMFIPFQYAKAIPNELKLGQFLGLQ